MNTFAVPTGFMGKRSATSPVLLQHNLKTLNLTHIARHLRERLRQAKDGGIRNEDLLLRLTDLELRIRADNREKHRLKEARFPLLKPLETFDFEAAPSLDRRLVRELAEGDYLRERRNIILLGRSGTGKTHLATDLGMKPAARAGVCASSPAMPWPTS